MKKNIFQYLLISFFFFILTSLLNAQSNMHELKESSADIHPLQADSSNFYTLTKYYLEINDSPFYQKTTPYYNFKMKNDFILVKDSSGKIKAIIYLSDKTSHPEKYRE